MWVVLAPLVLQVVSLSATGRSDLYVAVFEGEWGFVELGTVAVLLIAAWLGFASARTLARDRAGKAALLLRLFGVGCLFFAGEEVSWGQHLFGWSTPEVLGAYNTQNETNLHNLAFAKKDLWKWVVVAGTAWAAWLAVRSARQPGYRPRLLPSAWLVPTLASLPAALLVLATHVPMKLLWWTAGLNHVYGLNLRETTELYIGMFFLVYAASLHFRLHQARHAPSGVPIEPCDRAAAT